MPLHDVKCTKCGYIEHNHYESPWPDHVIHAIDGGELEILWNTNHCHDAAVHPLDRTVVYMDPKTGDVCYPAKADVDMPERYRVRGYQKVAFEHARELEQFERAHNVANESYWYNSGNGV